MKKSRTYFLVADLRDQTLSRSRLAVFVFFGLLLVMGMGVVAVHIQAHLGPERVMQVIDRVGFVCALVVSVPGAIGSWNVARSNLIHRPEAVSIALAIFVLFCLAIPALVGTAAGSLVQTLASF